MEDEDGLFTAVLFEDDGLEDLSSAAFLVGAEDPVPSPPLTVLCDADDPAMSPVPSDFFFAFTYKV